MPAAIPSSVVGKIQLPKKSTPAPTLASTFSQHHADLQKYKSGTPVIVNGNDLSLAAVIAIARYSASVELDQSPEVKQRVERSMRTIMDKLAAGKSVYGISTGFGGSAGTRTNDHMNLAKALLQMQHCGVIAQSSDSGDVLPVMDELASTTMPESWARAAMLVRINSLIRGHSGVRWILLEKMADLLQHHITPLVPLRGSISASGDLTCLSYVAGTLVGNPNIKVYSRRTPGQRSTITSAADALRKENLEPITFQPKEELGILNGTAFSAGVASLAIHDSMHLTLLSQALTAMGHEALLGHQGSHDPFIHDTCRPHPGQIETAANIFHLLQGSKLAVLEEGEEVSIEQDRGILRQDRYSLRTSPQFIGPQVEDIMHALKAVTQECNSTTDNPLVDGETGTVHHGGNFQAMAVTNAMEKTRLALHHLGKILFAQCTELLNPAFNNGLPPSAAASDPALNYFAKGLDIATSAYVSELGYLSNPVSTHIQSAEMHNQSINSLALISARQTLTSIDVLTMLASSYLLVLCQCLDIRAMQTAFEHTLASMIESGVEEFFSPYLASTAITSSELSTSLRTLLLRRLDETQNMDIRPRMTEVFKSSAAFLVDTFVDDSDALCAIGPFRSRLADRSATLYDQLRKEFLTGARGPAPASAMLGNTRPVYEFVRLTLGIPMHGLENFENFSNGFSEVTTGQNVSKIYNAIRRGDTHGLIAGLFPSA